MSGRKLGGGRILGSGRSLSPAHPPHNSSLLSPSASTLSVSSSATSQPSTDGPDLGSRGSLDQSDDSAAASAAAAAASSRLFCPICNEDMVTLLQLNRHLDDNHKNLEEVKQDEVKDWFEKQMTKAKRFQPLAVLNQKFKGLEVFEPNNTPRSPDTRPVASTPEPAPSDPDEVVTRAHWQRRSPDDRCGEPACGKRLTTMNGSVNCRRCGKLFCDEHTMYQMMLSRSAQHEPVRGLWCRVCETCYKSREGYNDRHGLERDDTDHFKQLRSKTVDKTLLDISRLQKRLTKLTQLLANPPAEQTLGSLWPLGGAKIHRKQLEQSVVDWEDDVNVQRCPFCHQEFSSYVFRRHHCRVCGRVVCADPLTDCSRDVPLSVATQNDHLTEKPTGEVALDLRMCKECRHTIFSRADFTASLTHKPPDVKAYENLIAFEHGIKLMLPKFQRLLATLQSPSHPPTPAQLADASRTRKRLVDAFGHYSTAARRVRDLPTTSPTQTKLQQAIYQQSYNFLQIHMLPLKALPKILRHASSAATPLPNGAVTNGTSKRPPSPSMAIIKSASPGLDSPTLSAASSSALEELEAEERRLRESLIVLEEQLWMVKESMEAATKRRQFDEAAALKRNVEDLRVEIERLQGRLSGLDFEGVYGGGSAGPASPSRRPKLLG